MIARMPPVQDILEKVYAKTFLFKILPVPPLKGTRVVR
jgi:hypothetical protein